MSKKVSRAKRKELRDKGEYEPPRRVPDAARAAARRADEAAESARMHAAREEIAETASRAEGPRPRARRDRTVLVLIGLTALAGLIFWLTQRAPAGKDTKIDVSPSPTSSAPK